LVLFKGEKIKNKKIFKKLRNKKFIIFLYQNIKKYDQDFGLVSKILCLKLLVDHRAGLSGWVDGWV
jgi:hypothetical protein